MALVGAAAVKSVLVLIVDAAPGGLIAFPTRPALFVRDTTVDIPVAHAGGVVGIRFETSLTLILVAIVGRLAAPGFVDTGVCVEIADVASSAVVLLLGAAVEVVDVGLTPTAGAALPTRFRLAIATPAVTIAIGASLALVMPFEAAVFVRVVVLALAGLFLARLAAIVANDLRARIKTTLLRADGFAQQTFLEFRRDLVDDPGTDWYHKGILDENSADFSKQCLRAYALIEHLEDLTARKFTNLGT
jgi:hypothetical protein